MPIRNQYPAGLSVALLTFLCFVLYVPGLVTVPPLDRDESRFAQASKQMLETGDLVEIRFQDTARNKKPAGAYWAQSLSVASLPGADTSQIWAYRVPSALAAWLGVLMIFALARSWMGGTLGFIAAALSAASLMLVLEAHQAKADALLFASIVAAQACLGVLYVRFRDGALSPLSDDQARWAAYGFWIAQGIALLIKGPIGPMISALTVAALVAADRDARWLRSLRPWPGIAIALAIALPWFIAIAVATGGAFFADSLGKDLFAKVASGQESHGAPPGYYAVLVHVMLWPAACVLWPAVLHAWRNRSEAWIRFALAWIIPAWVVFELVPTKLPHYVLPLYPALILLVVRFAGDVTQGAAWLGTAGRIGGAVIAALVPVALGVAALYAPIHFHAPTMGAGVWVASALLLGVAALSIGLVVPAYARGDALKGLRLGVVAAVLVFAVTLEGVLPRLDGMWLSRAITQTITADGGAAAPRASAGFHEPSLVFLAGTKTALVASGAAAAAWLEQNPNGYAIVSAEEDRAFKEALTATSDGGIAAVGTVSGINYSRGDAKRLTVYRRAPNPIPAPVPVPEPTDAPEASDT